MSYKQISSSVWHCLRIGVTGLALFQFTIGAHWPAPFRQVKMRTKTNSTPARPSST
jgi:hypothetical protein